MLQKWQGHSLQIKIFVDTLLLREANVGKPNKLMAELVFAHANLRPDECIIVGDRLYTDIAMGHAAGMDSALVFTGETTPKMLEEADLEAHPTYTLNNVREVFPL